MAFSGSAGRSWEHQLLGCLYYLRLSLLLFHTVALDRDRTTESVLSVTDSCISLKISSASFVFSTRLTLSALTGMRRVNLRNV